MNENECKHCDSLCIGINSENNRKELGIELDTANSMLIAYGLDKQGWDISVTCKINYCPMCGRKLKGGNN